MKSKVQNLQGVTHKVNQLPQAALSSEVGVRRELSDNVRQLSESVGEAEVRGGNNIWANLTMREENRALNQDAIN